MAQFADLAAPEMRATTGLHGNDAGRQTCEKLKYLVYFQLVAQISLT
jgi:hypothetical protein